MKIAFKCLLGLLLLSFSLAAWSGPDLFTQLLNEYSRTQDYDNSERNALGLVRELFERKEYQTIHQLIHETPENSYFFQVLSEVLAENPKGYVLEVPVSPERLQILEALKSKGVKTRQWGPLKFIFLNTITSPIWADNEKAVRFVAENFLRMYINSFSDSYKVEMQLSEFATSTEVPFIRLTDQILISLLQNREKIALDTVQRIWTTKPDLKKRAEIAMADPYHYMDWPEFKNKKKAKTQSRSRAPSCPGFFKTSFR